MHTTRFFAALTSATAPSSAAICSATGTSSVIRSSTPSRRRCRREANPLHRRQLRNPQHPNVRRGWARHPRWTSTSRPHRHPGLNAVEGFFRPTHKAAFETLAVFLRSFDLKAAIDRSSSNITPNRPLHMAAIPTIYPSRQTRAQVIDSIATSCDRIGRLASRRMLTASSRDIAVFRTYDDLLAAASGIAHGKIASCSRACVGPQDGSVYGALTGIRRYGPPKPKAGCRRLSVALAWHPIASSALIRSLNKRGGRRPRITVSGASRSQTPEQLRRLAALVLYDTGFC